MKITVEDLFNKISTIVGSRNVSIETLAIDKHSQDRSFHPSHKPDIVVWPTSTSGVSKIMKIAYNYSVPVTAYGAGTSLEGNPIPLKGGIVLNMTKMNKIIKVLPQDFQAIVQPGIIGDEFNSTLAKQILFFPAVPGSSHIASIGGMIANNAGGMHAVKYGVVGDWILKLEVVLANGDIITVGSRSFKSVAGYDLKSLFIGSEGTLGVITEATVRLITLPKDKLTFLVSFDDIDHATKATLEIMQAGVEPAAMEFMEKEYIELVNTAQPLHWENGPTIIVELQGRKDKFLQDSKTIEKICLANHCVSFHIASTIEEQKKIWDGRRAARPVIPKILPNSGVISGDIGIPLSRIPKFVKKVKEIGKKYDVKTFTFGHAGDGNFHVWKVYALNDSESFKRAKKVSEEVVSYALKAGGTCTAEHGVGIGKRQYLAQEHPSSLHLMKSIKKQFDPKGILNPGKVFLD